MSKLGEYIELSNATNVNEKYQVDDVKGISIKKMFIPTKADMDGVSLRNYLVIKPNNFCYVTVTSRNGEKISLAFNSSKETFIVSSSYVSFYVKDEKKLLPEYLFMYFNRPEFDRYSRFNSWGSARETFSFEDLCDIEIDVPPLEKQQQAVDVYLALVENQKKYEKGLDDLKLTCDAYIEELRRTLPLMQIGLFIKEVKEINKNLEIDYERGLNKEFGFVEPGSMSSNVDLSKRKIIRYNTFVYPPPHFGEQGTIGLNKGKDCIMSQMYTSFILNSQFISPDYLFLWFKRSEFMRFGFFAASDSIRDTFDLEKLGDYKVPIPEITIQKSIAAIYDVYNKRMQINEKIKHYISKICPILIKGSING